MPSPDDPRRGLFITLEGGDGAGKTTQLERLTSWLWARGERVLVTAEPGGSALGEAIAEWLRGRGPEAPTPRAEALLFLAARAQHVERLIQPALAAGTTVLCSRFSHSTLAYQCAGLGLDETAVAAADAFARDGLKPDVVLVLDLDAAGAAARRAGRGQAEDAIEARAAAFHERVRAGFRRAAALEPERVRLIDAGGDADSVQAAIAAALEPWLRDREP
jgi:dTMP kinase